MGWQKQRDKVRKGNVRRSSRSEFEPCSHPLLYCSVEKITFIELQPV
jgi:hypothetical protein